MKKLPYLLLPFIFLMAGANAIAQQNNTDNKEIQKMDKEEDDGPSLFKFEPTYMTSMAAKRERLRRTRELLDTMDISDRKRKRLLKDLYKNGLTDRLELLLTETKFEDEIVD
ncbi:hypothetical protein [Maribacter sp. 2-571]|uniref:hypothetical protein n=1 Tax=Maribacter sp. 2-571 TaxID=3417569 RepID=UPI003D3298E5